MSVMREYCSECDQLSDFTTVHVNETLKIKGIDIENEHTYYKCSHCGELFEPFDDPDFNIKSDYELYRNKLGLLSPERIKKIRESYSLSLRQFAELIGISYSTLSEVENGSLQSKHLDSTLRLAENPFSIRSLYYSKKNYLKEDFEKFEDSIDAICLTSVDENAVIIEKFNKKINTMWETNRELVRVSNMLQYESDETKRAVKIEERSTWKKQTLEKVFNLAGLL